MSSLTPTRGPVLLAILDGWGCGASNAGNAIQQARKPNMDRWLQEYPHTTLIANGEAVGLPAGQMGNSEVGHLNIGAGRIVYQDFTRINLALRNGEFFSNPVLVESMARCQNGGALHLLGLVSDGGVHSHLDHLLGLVEMAARNGLRRVFIHAFLDGRDTPPRSGLVYLERLQSELDRIGVGQVATVSGRYYAMDRDKRWDRVELAWQALVGGRGLVANDPLAAVQVAYGRDESDEFVKPTVIVGENGQPLGNIASGDSVIFFNFRADRARQLTRVFTFEDFTGFARGERPQLAEFVTFTSYEKDFALPVAFPPQSLTHILGEEVSSHGLPQLRIAETEKYAHVTFFFNGGREEPFPGEDRVLIPSPREVATYDLKPEMSAPLVAEELLSRLREERYRLIVLNFANCDMVGHSGIMAAAIKACETVDECLGRLVAEVQRQNGVVLITADHGNAEIMVDPESGGPFTAHSTNPVPFLLVDKANLGGKLVDGGSLKDIAPTVLELLGVPVPAEMEGRSLIG